MKRKTLSLILLGCVSFISAAVYSANPFLKGESTILSGSIDEDNSKAIIIVMDASGSMSEPAPGAASKMLMAKKVLEQVCEFMVAQHLAQTQLVLAKIVFY